MNSLIGPDAVTIPVINGQLACPSCDQRFDMREPGKDPRSVMYAAREHVLSCDEAR